LLVVAGAAVVVVVVVVVFAMPCVLTDVKLSVRIIYLCQWHTHVAVR